MRGHIDFDDAPTLLDAIFSGESDHRLERGLALLGRCWYLAVLTCNKYCGTARWQKHEVTLGMLTIEQLPLLRGHILDDEGHKFPGTDQFIFGTRRNRHGSLPRVRRGPRSKIGDQRHSCLLRTFRNRPTSARTCCVATTTPCRVPNRCNSRVRRLLRHGRFAPSFCQTN